MDWPIYLKEIANAIKNKSEDPSTQVGAVIIDKNRRIVSTGYNGWVAGCNEVLMSWEDRDLKLEMVIHAEMNALIFAKQDLKGCEVYSTHSPCSNCLKHLLQAGIRAIYYDSPEIIVERGGDLQKDAIRRLIQANDIVVGNVNNGMSYIEELFD